MKLSVRQQAIMDAALGLINERGIQSLTMKNLSGALSVSEPALYRHFSNKFEILDTLLDYFNFGAESALNSVEFKTLSPLEQIEFFIYNRVAQVETNPRLAKVMFSEEFFQDDPRLAGKMLQMMHSHKNVLITAIENGQRGGVIRADIDAVTVFRLVFGPLRLVFKQWALSGFKFNLRSEVDKLWQAELKILEVASSVNIVPKPKN